MSLEACLPANLQLPSTTITRVAAGLSGAGVYRVDTDAGAFVLKVAGTDQPLTHWRHKLEMLQIASSAGVAPRVVHVDESRRAIVSEFVVDKLFPALFGNPATREGALGLLARTLRRVHDLPLPADSPFHDPKDFLADMWSRLDGFPLPPFVAEAAHRMLAEAAQVPEGVRVFSHNDVNPTNIVYDGEKLLLLDWDTSGPNDPFYDLAAVSVFFRMDVDTRKRLLSAYTDAPVDSLPERFNTCRRLAAVLCGLMFLRLARYGGHAGATGDESIESTLSLIDFYQRMRAGAVDVATADGQWLFGLALVKESLAS